MRKKTIETKLRDTHAYFSRFDTLSLSPIITGTGVNNTNFKVIADDSVYFLRRASLNARFLGIDRAEELAAAHAAATIGLAPRIICVEPDGLLLTEFIFGHHWTPTEAAAPNSIQRIAKTLRTLHTISNVAATCSVYQRIERLLSSANALELTLPRELPRLHDWLSKIEQQRNADTRFPHGLCHGDFWLHNFLDDGEKLWLIDWEFAGIGDGMTDLAKIVIGGSQYAETQQRLLLSAYGYTEPDDLERLTQMTRVLRSFEAVWALVQHGLRGSDDPSGFDYLAHSQQTFASLFGAI
jgi:thiamine kinase-like enzyme